MKKLLFTAAIALCGLGLINAQEIDFGAKAGVNFANFSGDDVEDTDARTGIVLGLTGEIGLGESLGIEAGLLYSQQGYKVEEQGVDVTAKFDYLNVPIALKYYISDSGFAVQAGPQIGFLMSDTFEVGDDEVDSEDVFGIEAETLDLAALLGVQYKFKEGSSLEGFLIDGRYNLGLSNVYDVDDADIKNGVFQITVGYVF